MIAHSFEPGILLSYSITDNTYFILSHDEGGLLYITSYYVRVGPVNHIAYMPNVRYLDVLVET